MEDSERIVDFVSFLFCCLSFIGSSILFTSLFIIRRRQSKSFQYRLKHRTRAIILTTHVFYMSLNDIILSIWGIITFGAATGNIMIANSNTDHYSIDSVFSSWNALLDNGPCLLLAIVSQFSSLGSALWYLMISYCIWQILLGIHPFYPRVSKLPPLKDKQRMYQSPNDSQKFSKKFSNKKGNNNNDSKNDNKNDSNKNKKSGNNWNNNNRKDSEGNLNEYKQFIEQYYSQNRRANGNNRGIPRYGSYDSYASSTLKNNNKKQKKNNEQYSKNASNNASNNASHNTSLSQYSLIRPTFHLFESSNVSQPSIMDNNWIFIDHDNETDAKNSNFNKNKIDSNNNNKSRGSTFKPRSHSYNVAPRILNNNNNNDNDDTIFDVYKNGSFSPRNKRQETKEIKEIKEQKNENENENEIENLMRMQADAMKNSVVSNHSKSSEKMMKQPNLLNEQSNNSVSQGTVVIHHGSQFTNDTVPIRYSVISSHQASSKNEQGVASTTSPQATQQQQQEESNNNTRNSNGTRITVVTNETGQSGQNGDGTASRQSVIRRASSFSHSMSNSNEHGASPTQAQKTATLKELTMATATTATTATTAGAVGNRSERSAQSSNENVHLRQNSATHSIAALTHRSTMSQQSNEMDFEFTNDIDQIDDDNNDNNSVTVDSLNDGGMPALDNQFTNTTYYEARNNATSVTSISYSDTNAIPVPHTPAKASTNNPILLANYPSVISANSTVTSNNNNNNNNTIDSAYNASLTAANANHSIATSQSIPTLPHPNSSGNSNSNNSNSSSSSSSTNDPMAVAMAGSQAKYAVWVPKDPQKYGYVGKWEIASQPHTKPPLPHAQSLPQSQGFVGKPPLTGSTSNNLTTIRTFTSNDGTTNQVSIARQAARLRKPRMSDQQFISQSSPMLIPTASMPLPILPTHTSNLSNHSIVTSGTVVSTTKNETFENDSKNTTSNNNNNYNNYNDSGMMNEISKLAIAKNKTLGNIDVETRKNQRDISWMDYENMDAAFERAGLSRSRFAYEFAKLLERRVYRKKIVRRHHWFVWVLCLIFTALPFAFNAMGNDIEWKSGESYVTQCWISDTKWVFSLYAVVTVVLLNGILLLAVTFFKFLKRIKVLFSQIRGDLNQNNESNKQQKNNKYKYNYENNGKNGTIKKINLSSNGNIISSTTTTTTKTHKKKKSQHGWKKYKLSRSGSSKKNKHKNKYRRNKNENETTNTPLMMHTPQRYDKGNSKNSKQNDNVIKVDNSDSDDSLTNSNISYTNDENNNKNKNDNHNNNNNNNNGCCQTLKQASDQSKESVEWKMLSRFGFFVGIYILCWTLPIIRRYWTLIEGNDDSRNTPDWLGTANQVSVSIFGFMNAMVWLTNASFKRAWNESKELTFAPEIMTSHEEATVAEAKAASAMHNRQHTTEIYPSTFHAFTSHKSNSKNQLMFHYPQTATSATAALMAVSNENIVTKAATTMAIPIEHSDTITSENRKNNDNNKKKKKKKNKRYMRPNIDGSVSWNFSSNNNSFNASIATSNNTHHNHKHNDNNNNNNNNNFDSLLRKNSHNISASHHENIYNASNYGYGMHYANTHGAAYIRAPSLRDDATTDDAGDDSDANIIFNDGSGYHNNNDGIVGGGTGVRKTNSGNEPHHIHDDNNMQGTGGILASLATLSRRNIVDNDDIETNRHNNGNSNTGNTGASGASSLTSMKLFETSQTGAQSVGQSLISHCDSEHGKVVFENYSMHDRLLPPVPDEDKESDANTTQENEEMKSTKSTKQMGKKSSLKSFAQRLTSSFHSTDQSHESAPVPNLAHKPKQRSLLDIFLPSQNNSNETSENNDNYHINDNNNHDNDNHHHNNNSNKKDRKYSSSLIDEKDKPKQGLEFQVAHSNEFDPAIDIREHYYPVPYLPYNSDHYFGYGSTTERVPLSTNYGILPFMHTKHLSQQSLHPSMLASNHNNQSHHLKTHSQPSGMMYSNSNNQYNGNDGNSLGYSLDDQPSSYQSKSAISQSNVSATNPHFIKMLKNKHKSNQKRKAMAQAAAAAAAQNGENYNDDNNNNINHHGTNNNQFLSVGYANLSSTLPLPTPGHGNNYNNNHNNNNGNNQYKKRRGMDNMNDVDARKSRLASTLSENSLNSMQSGMSSNVTSGMDAYNRDYKQIDYYKYMTCMAPDSDSDNNNTNTNENNQTQSKMTPIQDSYDADIPPITPITPATENKNNEISDININIENSNGSIMDEIMNDTSMPNDNDIMARQYKFMPANDEAPSNSNSNLPQLHAQQQQSQQHLQAPFQQAQYMYHHQSQQAQQPPTPLLAHLTHAQQMELLMNQQRANMRIMPHITDELDITVDDLHGLSGRSARSQQSHRARQRLGSMVSNTSSEETADVSFGDMDSADLNFMNDHFSDLGSTLSHNTSIAQSHHTQQHNSNSNNNNGNNNNNNNSDRRNSGAISPYMRPIAIGASPNPRKSSNLSNASSNQRQKHRYKHHHQHRHHGQHGQQAHMGNLSPQLNSRSPVVTPVNQNIANNNKNDKNDSQANNDNNNENKEKELETKLVKENEKNENDENDDNGQPTLSLTQFSKKSTSSINSEKVVKLLDQELLLQDKPTQ